ncbi:MAG: hypothetical protein A2636_05185 [Elusimicrobia bacterium RIFCSPHIGHO2_01_FULL_64_10]|nr:MAG: hypothetical protein A2636_05185 [Elusimicrobia bacterium RIFCSPHIGHO2_01_FULL_64_10]
MRLKLFPKIALILVFLATLPVIIVGWQTSSLNQEHLESNILELHTNLANSLAKRIGIYLSSVASKLRAFVDSLRMQGIISAVPFQTFLNANGEFKVVSFLNSGGVELLKAISDGAGPEEEKLLDRSGDPVYLSYRGQDQKVGAFEPKFDFSFKNRRPSFTIVFPYHPRDPKQGALYVEISLEDLWKDIITQGAGVGGGGREAFVADEKGRVIAHSDGRIGAETDFSANPIVREALQKKTIGSKEYADAGGRPIVGAYAAVDWAGWVAVIQQPKDAAYFAVRETRRRALQIVLISLGAAALAAFVLAKNLSRPIFNLIEGARAIARGDFDAAVDIHSNDEMGDLARTFNEMSRELKRYNELQVDLIIEEKTKTESVIFSIADGILLTDRSGSIQLLNDQAADIFSLKRPAQENLIGRNLLELVPDAKAKKTLGEFLSDPEAHQKKEIVLPGGGRERHFQLSSEPVYAPRTKKNIGVVTVVHDVTLEREMDRLKENFLHSITHDLRNPMTSIQGFVRFLKEEVAGPVNDKQLKMLETMDRAGMRLIGMINDILDSAKIEAGKMELEIGAVPMRRVLEDVRDLYAPFAERKSIHLILDLPAGDGEFAIQGDRSLIERVAGNLAANAIKYTPYDGNVHISLEDFPDKVQVAVSDDGPGIPEEYRESVFEKFKQVQGEKHGGTGLGLTICRYFVELHGGKIWLESEVGKGSRFIFWIPKGLKRGKASGAAAS